ncbi:MAG: hypothetical protein IKG14_02385 [Clostridia bacterium]|nr:hypothetical protein [Clostridia bacterium]
MCISKPFNSDEDKLSISLQSQIEDQKCVDEETSSLSGALKYAKNMARVSKLLEENQSFVDLFKE